MILKNKIALITGASGTIGANVAAFFAKEGCSLMLSGRNDTQLKKIQEDLKKYCSVEIFPSDVTKIDDVKKLMQFTEQKFGSLSVLVTAAGTYGEIGTIEQCDPVKWLSAINVNLWGTMLCVKYALPLLRKSAKSKIITFAGGGEGAFPNFTAYASSKGAILRFTESVAEELSGQGIEVNAISPGLVNSGLSRELIGAGRKRVGSTKYQDTLDETAGSKETVSPEFAARLAVFLASEKSDGISGKNISARYDNFEEFPKHLKEIKQTDIFTWRRVKPKDRGYDW